MNPSAFPLSETENPDLKEYSLAQLLLYFLKLGTLGFGGPIALIGYMERDLVETRRWISKEQYLRGLALSQLAPGPLAAQLAKYIGYVKRGFVGAALTGFAFVLPSFLMVLVLGWLYVRFGGLPWMQSAFYGVGAAVIGIIVNSARKLVKMTLKKSPLLWGIFLVMAGMTAYTQREIVWLFLLGGFLSLGFHLIPRIRHGTLPVIFPPFIPALFQGSAQLPSVPPGLENIFLYFVKAGAFVFGSGLAIVPFLYGGVVQEHHWLTERQFLDAVAVAMITPGPIVITVGFIGYLLSGFWGASAAAFGTFAPTYLCVIVLAPYFEKHGKNPGLAVFVAGVTAAATGAIAGAVFVLGRRSVVDVPTILIALASFLVVTRTKFPEPILILIAGTLGWTLHHFGIGA